MSNDVVVPPSDHLPTGGITVAKVLLGVGAIFLIPAILTLIWNLFLIGIGIFGLAATAVIGLGLWKALPLLGQKWDNFILGARIAEAMKNPINQLKNSLIFKAQQLNAFKASLLKAKTDIMGLADSLKVQKKKDPGIDLTDEQAAVDKMNQWWDNRKRNYDTALAAYDEFSKEVDRATFKFGFGNAAAGVAKVMNDQDAEKVMQGMLSDAAFKSVNTRFNSAFAQLDLDVAEINTQKLDFGAGQTLNVAPLALPVNQSVALPVQLQTAAAVKA